MTGRERVQRALTFRSPDRAPRDLWALPGIEMFRRDELAAVRRRFPPDIAPPVFAYGRSPAAHGTPNVIGTYTDAWGCGWKVAEDGVVGEVRRWRRWPIGPRSSASGLLTRSWSMPISAAWMRAARKALTFGKPADVAAAVRRVRAALDDGAGGVIAQCEWGIGVSQENVEAVYETWLEPAG